jgi:hypothetical protein
MLLQELRVLAAVRHHPADVAVAVVQRRRCIEAIGLGHIRARAARQARAGQGAGGTEQKRPSLHVSLQST